MGIVGEMQVLIRPLDTGFASALQTKLKAATQQVVEAGKNAGSVFQNAGAAAAAGLAVAGVAAAAFALKAAAQFRTVGGEVLKLQRFTGGSAAELSKLRFAAQQSGIDTDKLATSLKFLSKNIEAGNAAFAQNSIATTDASGRTLGLNDILLNAAARFEGMAAGSAKNALALQLFGRAGTDLLPFLNKGRDGIEALEKETAKYGLVLTQGNLNAVKKATEAQRQQTAAMQGLEVQIGSRLLPALTQLTRAFTTGLVAVMPLIAGIVTGLVVPAFTVLSSILGVAARFIGENATAVRAFALIAGGLLVPVLAEWAAAQTALIAGRLIQYLTGLSTLVTTAATRLGILNAETRQVSTATTGAAGALGIAAVATAGFIVVINKAKSDSEKWASSFVDSSKSIAANIDSVKAALKDVPVPGPLSFFTGGGDLVGRTKALKKELKDLEAQQRAQAAATVVENDAATALASKFAGVGAVFHASGQAVAITDDLIKQLAKTMNIDLSKATDETLKPLYDMVARLTVASPAALQLADAMKILADPLKDATEKAAAFGQVLDNTIGKNIANIQGAVDWASKLHDVSDQLLGTTQSARTLEDAQQRVSDATLGLSDKTATLSKLQKLAVVDTAAVAAASRQLRDATLAVTSSRLQLVDAERTLYDIQHPSARTKEDAQVGLSESKNNETRASIRLGDAIKTLRDLRASGTATAEELRLAELDVSDAHNALVRANESVYDSTAKLNALTPIGIALSRTTYNAEQAVEAAKRQVSDAIDSQRAAAVALATAQLGDINRSTELATATRDVAAAKVELTRATEDLTVLMADRQANAFDLNTQKGRDNLSVVLSLTQQTVDWAKQIEATTGNMGLARSIIDTYVGQLTTLLGKLGLNTQQTTAFLGQLGLLPQQLTTTIGLKDNLSAPFAQLIGRIVNEGLAIQYTLQGSHYIQDNVTRVGANATGGIIRKPMLSTLAENGPEVVLPLNDEARMRALISQAGISHLFYPSASTGSSIRSSSTSSGTSGSTVIVQAGAISVTVTVDGSSDLDKDELQAAGMAFGSGLLEGYLAKRELEVRARTVR